MNKHIQAGLFILASTIQVHAQLYNGFKGYISLDLLSPGQLRYTTQNVQTKAKKQLKTHFYFDNGQSSLNISDAIPVILGPNNLIILVDSHHEYLASRSIGDTTVPIIVKDDLSRLSREEFYTVAQDKNYIYPYDILGKKIPLASTGWYKWSDMVDDPNRLFASLSALKCTGDNCTKDPNASEIPHHPLWIKQLNKKFELAFIEFKIATALYEAGLEYDYNWGTNPNSKKLLEFTERARLVLEEIVLKGELPQLELVTSDYMLGQYTIS